MPLQFNHFYTLFGTEINQSQLKNDINFSSKTEIHFHIAIHTDKYVINKVNSSLCSCKPIETEIENKHTRKHRHQTHPNRIHNKNGQIKYIKHGNQELEILEAQNTHTHKVNRKYIRNKSSDVYMNILIHF